MAADMLVKPVRFFGFSSTLDFVNSSIDKESADEFEDAFRAALLLTGSLEGAEEAVAAGIKYLDERGSQPLIAETVKAALHRTAVAADPLDPGLLHLPPELRHVGGLPRELRHGFVLRMLLRYDRQTCARLQRVSPEECDRLLSLAVTRLSLAGAGLSSVAQDAL